MTARTIAIGDIHGCATALERLLQAIKPSPDDLLIVLGDIVDRGPDTRRAIDILLALRQQCRLIVIQGNHEEMLLTAWANSTTATLYPWLTHGGKATLDSYGPGIGPGDLPTDHIDFLKECLPYFETETHIFLHANYDPNLPLAEQSIHSLRWESLRDYIPVRHVSGKTVVVGHTPQDETILDRGYLKCIDTRCYAGGWLTALDIHSGRMWQANQQGTVR